MGKCPLQCRWGPRLADSPPTGYPSSSSSWGFFAVGRSETTLPLSQTPTKISILWATASWLSVGCCFCATSWCRVASHPCPRHSDQEVTTWLSPRPHNCGSIFSSSLGKRHFVPLPFTGALPQQPFSARATATCPSVSCPCPSSPSAAPLVSPAHTQHSSLGAEGAVSLLVHSYLIGTSNCLLLSEKYFYGLTMSEGSGPLHSADQTCLLMLSSVSICTLPE